MTFVPPFPRRLAFPHGALMQFSRQGLSHVVNLGSYDTRTLFGPPFELFPALTPQGLGGLPFAGVRSFDPYLTMSSPAFSPPTTDLPFPSRHWALNVLAWFTSARVGPRTAHFLSSHLTVLYEPFRTSPSFSTRLLFGLLTVPMKSTFSFSLFESSSVTLCQFGW